MERRTRGVARIVWLVVAVLAALAVGLGDVEMFLPGLSVAGARDCVVGPPQRDCYQTRRYYVSHVYVTRSGERHVVLQLEIEGSLAANYCPPYFCTPDLIDAGHSDLFGELRPGIGVRGVVWHDRIVLIRGSDGKEMDTS